MRWLRYTLTPKARISAGRRGEVHFDRPVYAVIPGTVIRGALAAAWWKEHDDQAQFDRLFAERLRVYLAAPRRGDERADLIPMSWSRPKYDRGDYQPGGVADSGRVAGRGWDVPRALLVETTRTALEGGVAVKGQLFTRRAVRKDVELVGYLCVDDDAGTGWLTTDRSLWVGGDASVAGKCEWRCEEVEDPFPVPPPGDVTVTLLQAAILLDEYGANSLDLAGAVKRAIADAGGNAIVRNEVVRPEQVGGWHGRAGFPKPMEWALGAGSSVTLTAADEKALLTLRAGIGIRRQEGYGAIAITAQHERPDYFGSLAPAPRAAPVAERPRPRTLQERVDDLVERLDGSANAVNGMLDAARTQKGKQGPARAMVVSQALGLPWAKALHPDVLTEIDELMRRSKPAELVTALEKHR